MSAINGNGTSYSGNNNLTVNNLTVCRVHQHPSNTNSNNSGIGKTLSNIAAFIQESVLSIFDFISWVWGFVWQGQNSTNTENQVAKLGEPKGKGVTDEDIEKFAKEISKEVVDQLNDNPESSGRLVFKIDGSELNKNDSTTSYIENIRPVKLPYNDTFSNTTTLVIKQELEKIRNKSRGSFSVTFAPSKNNKGYVVITCAVKTES